MGKHSFEPRHVRLLLALLMALTAHPLQAQILWDNGPYYNSIGTGLGGANESVLYSTSLGMALIAHGTNGSRLADEFEIRNCRWRIDSVAVFGYQLLSGTIPTFTDLNWRLWDGNPGNPNSNVVAGDSLTNRFIGARWSNAYRVWEGNNGNGDRPIMRIVADMGGLVLPTGEYWVDWAARGSVGNSWFPPRTPVGQSFTGNGWHYMNGAWNPCVDPGTGDAQGLPFIIYGQVLAPVIEAGPHRSICAGDSTDLGANPTATGGTGPVTYLWSPSTGLSSINTPNPQASPAATTSYFLTVTDSAGCTVSDTVAVVIGALSTTIIGSDTILCHGVTLTVDAGPAQGYQWSTGASTQSVTLGPGTHYVDVDYGTGCLSTDTIVIRSQTPVTVIGDTSFCAVKGDTLCANGPYSSFSWSNGSIDSCTIVHTTGVWALTAIDSLGCISTDSISVTALPSPVANFSFTSSGNGLNYSFTDLSTDATAWLWRFGDGNTSTQQNPTHSYTVHGNYVVQLTALNNCYSDTLTMAIAATAVAEERGRDVHISPQPATDRLHLQVQGLHEGAFHATLLDLQGRQVATWDWENAGPCLDVQLDIAPHSPGMYLLALRQGDLATTHKVLIGR